MDFYGLFVSVRECVRGKFVYLYPLLIPSLSLRSGIGVVTVLQGYCKGIAKVLYKPVMNP